MVMVVVLVRGKKKIIAKHGENGNTIDPAASISS
jgi:hypothetical protein